MLKKTIAPLLIVTVMLFTLELSKVFAQTPAQPKAAESEHTLNNAPLKPQPDLKAVFATEIMNAKNRTPTAADYKLMAKKQQQATGNSLTKREKIGLIVFIVAMVAITTALLIRGINTEPNCFEDIFNPECN
ncbi:MAG TPA: hypothetical protein VF658_05910 [Pyrinomonadaceae bacterium]|jgi:hypothetical protein